MSQEESDMVRSSSELDQASLDGGSDSDVPRDLDKEKDRRRGSKLAANKVRKQTYERRPSVLRDVVLDSEDADALVSEASKDALIDDLVSFANLVSVEVPRGGSKGASKENANTDSGSESDSDDPARARTWTKRKKAKKDGYGSDLPPDRKELLRVGVEKFNQRLNQGFRFLVEEGLVKEDSVEFAKFLYSCTGLSKVKIGVFLGSANEFNVAVLNHFVDMIDFSDLVFDDALRLFLSYFRLPGEAQQIDRIMEHFASSYCKANPEAFQNKDTAYILAFSLIMLNTDAHSPHVARKMTVQGFLRNLAGVDTEVLNEEYLTFLYNRIVAEEIEFEEDHSDFSNPDMEGWMFKQGGRVKNWKKRFVILSSHCLYYFKDKACTQPSGIVPLENLVVKTGLKQGQHFRPAKNIGTFVIYSPNDKFVKSAKFIGGQIVEGHHDNFTFCVSGETLVSLSNGTSVSIRSLSSPSSFESNLCTLSLPSTTTTTTTSPSPHSVVNDTCISPIVSYFEQPILRDCVCVHFLDGTSLTCTPDHRIRCVNTRLIVRASKLFFSIRDELSAAVRSGCDDALSSLSPESLSHLKDCDSFKNIVSVMSTPNHEPTTATQLLEQSFGDLYSSIATQHVWPHLEWVEAGSLLGGAGSSEPGSSSFSVLSSCRKGVIPCGDATGASDVCFSIPSVGDTSSLQGLLRLQCFARLAGLYVRSCGGSSDDDVDHNDRSYFALDDVRDVEFVRRDLEMFCSSEKESSTREGDYFVNIVSGEKLHFLAVPKSLEALFIRENIQQCSLCLKPSSFDIPACFLSASAPHLLLSPPSIFREFLASSLSSSSMMQFEEKSSCVSIPLCLSQRDEDCVHSFVSKEFDIDCRFVGKGSAQETTKHLLIYSVGDYNKNVGVRYSSQAARSWALLEAFEGYVQKTTQPMAFESFVYSNASFDWGVSSSSEGRMVFFRRVTRLESVGMQTVYDIEVESGESFVADGVVVHNCASGEEERDEWMNVVQSTMLSNPYHGILLEQKRMNIMNSAKK